MTKYLHCKCFCGLSKCEIHFNSFMITVAVFFFSFSLILNDAKVNLSPNTIFAMTDLLSYFKQRMLLWHHRRNWTIFWGGPLAPSWLRSCVAFNCKLSSSKTQFYNYTFNNTFSTLKRHSPKFHWHFLCGEIENSSEFSPKFQFEA